MHFSVMAAIICIKKVRGTFCQLVNIPNRFLHIFPNLVTPIKSCSPGGALKPIFRLYYLQNCGERGWGGLQVTFQRCTFFFVIL